MNEKTNRLLQQSANLHERVNLHIERLTPMGITAAKNDELQGIRLDLRDKLRLQEEKLNARKAKTRLQNEKIHQLGNAIRRVRGFARVAFMDNPGVLAEFHIGERVPITVNGIMTDAEHMKARAVNYMAALAAGGMIQADVDAVGTAQAGVEAADVDQEYAKQEAKSATAAYKTAEKELKKRMQEIQRTAEVCFANEPLLLREFRDLD